MTNSPQPFSTALFSNKTATGFMDEGLKRHAEFKRLFVSSKEAAIDAGYYFYRARAEVGDGNFSEFLQCYNSRITRTTVYRYVEFVGEVLAWAADDSPNLIGKIEALIKRGKELVMQSPKGYIALCRQLEVMRKFGDYDQVKYAKSKLGGARQVEFDFLDVCEALDFITQLGQPDVIWKLPEGKQTPEALRDLSTKLDAAKKQVDEQLKNTEAISIENHDGADPIPKFSAYVNRWGSLFVESYDLKKECDWMNEPSIAAVIRGVCGECIEEAIFEARQRYKAGHCSFTPTADHHGKPELKD